MKVVNLRIENKKLSTLESIRQKSENKDSVFKSPVVYPFKDPLFVRDLDIWINNKKVDTALIEHLEVNILPGRDIASANIKFTSQDYFIEGNSPEDWETYLDPKRYFKEDRLTSLKTYSFRNKLFEENSNEVIISGIPIDNINGVTRGFDVDSYISGLTEPPTKVKIILRPYSPLELEVTYAPTQLSININVSLNPNPESSLLDDSRFTTSLFDSEGLEIARFIDFAEGDILLLSRGIILDKTYIDKINREDSYTIKTLDKEYCGVKLNATGYSIIPGGRVTITSIGANYK